jgi:amino acid permease
MDQLLRLKQLRIKKDMLLLTLAEKKKRRALSILYLAVFIMLFILMITLDPNPNSADPNNSLNESAAKFLKFVAGKFLLVSIYFGYRTYRSSKEIRGLKKESTEMERKLRYLSN